MNTFLILLDLLILLRSVRGQVPGKQTLRLLTFSDRSFIRGCSREQYWRRVRKQKETQKERWTTVQLQRGLSWSYVELGSWNDSSELLQTETTGLNIFGCWLSPGQSITWGKVVSFSSGQFPEEELSCEPFAANMPEPELWVPWSQKDRLGTQQPLYTHYVWLHHHVRKRERWQDRNKQREKSE